jgi:hypothetical protein
VDVTATLAADVPVDALFDVVEDLGTYPDWLDIVSRAEPVDVVAADAAEPEGRVDGAAWSVDIRGQVGPFRRSKRLRMVRTRCERPNEVRFERREHDGRRHSEWVLSAELLDPASGGVPELRMRLHYGGNLWVPMLDRLLSDEIERSRPRLVEYVNGRSAG